MAVLTYRKNAYAPGEEEFKTYKITIEGVEVEMKLAEKQEVLNGVSMREVCKLGSKGHQTSILTTNQIITIESAATYMFARWSQENFFK